MGDAPTDKQATPGKWNPMALAILLAVLVGALVWSLTRALSVLSNETGDRVVPPASEGAAMDAVLSQEEIDRQHAMSPPPPAMPVPVAAPAAVTPANQNNAKVILQKEKMKFNEQIVERLKQYVKDNPTRDTRELEMQIKKRESQGAQIQ